MDSIRIFDHQKVGQGHELQSRRLRRWLFFMAYKTVTMTDLSQNFFVVHQRDTHTHTHTHTSRR